MKKLVIATAAAFALSTVAATASAQSHHSSGGNWRGGSSNWHGGGDWHGVRHGGSRFALGLSFGFPAYYYWGPGYYPYAYAYPYPYSYYDGYWYDYGAPETYIQRDSGDAVAPPVPTPRDQYSYYCTNPAGYYPQVPSCPSGWLTVVPNSSPRAAPR